MKPDKSTFNIHEFVQAHTESEIRESRCFCVVGAKDHKGWSLKDSVKSRLADIGFTPFGETKKMNWRIDAWDEIEKIMSESRLNACDKEDAGVPISDAEATNSILQGVLCILKRIEENQRVMIGKWN